jgi:hypothetical protein
MASLCQLQKDFLQSFFLVVFIDFIQGTTGDNLSFVDNSKAIAEPFCHLQDMGGEKHRIPMATVFAHQVLKQKGGTGVKPYHRFIHDPDRWVVQECPGQNQFLFHAVGVTLHQVTDGLLDAEDLQEVLNALSYCILLHYVQ